MELSRKSKYAIGAAALLIAAGGGAAAVAATHGNSPSDESRAIIDDAVRGNVRFAGLLASELRTAGTPAERQAARLVLRAFQDFMAADAEVRNAVAVGDHARALGIALGTGGGQLASAFGELDEAFATSVSSEASTPRRAISG